MSKKEFEPIIIAFCCNWCAYAGADLAGVSRIQYPPNIRIIRVMCTGMVDESYILKAFENGADGVLVAGCHPGDCHYISGNLKAEKEVEKTKKLLDLMGLESRRLRLEWISASEGEKFARVVKEFVEELKKLGPNPLKLKIETHATNGGKEVKKVRETKTFADEILSEEKLWKCLGCYLCHVTCPSNISISEFIRVYRSLTPRDEVDQYSAHGAVPLMMARMMANPNLKPNRLNWLPKDVKVSKKGEILYFVGCLPYFDVEFEEYSPNHSKIAIAAIKILNKLGIEPVILPEERCCGHDLLWTGDFENFEKLAHLNVKYIEEAEAKTVIMTCPEGYRTFKIDYEDLLGGLDFEVMHLSEFISNMINEGKLKFEKKIERKVTYHDPCRLGRHLGVYDAPRNVLSSIPGIELVEMKRNKEEAQCCGVSSWLLCGESSKQMQLDRLKEAVETGAEQLVVGCHKCKLHFSCVMSEKLPPGYENIKINVVDLTEVIAEAMGIKIE